MGNLLNREIRLALWKIRILHHAAKEDVYGMWMLEELAGHGHHVSPGTLYPILARMEQNGWLRSRSRESGNARRTYRTTAAGERVLRQLRTEIVELYDEVVRGKEPAERRSAGSAVTRALSRGNRTRSLVRWRRP